MSEEQHMMGVKGGVLMGFGKIQANEAFRRQMGNKEGAAVVFCTSPRSRLPAQLPPGSVHWQTSASVLLFIQM